MPTYYIDFEGGNDANDGLSFAQRWKTFTLGATTARIAPGDTIRVMASPDPTSVGNATWTNGPRPATVSIASSTNATPIVVTTSTAHNLVAGDYVSIASHTLNTNANGTWLVGTVGSSTTFQLLKMDGTNTTGNGAGGASGTAQKSTNCFVKLAAPVTQNIALCGGSAEKPAWTASTNVTATRTTSNWKEGYTSASIDIATAFTTGKAAYYTLPATLNLSGYQQVSFWVRQNAGVVGAAGSVYVALCSDTLGSTVVNIANIPALGAVNVWVPVVVNLGANLGASIRSVAFYVVTDNGAQTFLIDNIIACKAASAADSLNLTSLVSKSNGTGDEAWYAIQSINGNAVMLANRNSLTSANAGIRGYLGTTETVSTYKRETIKITPVGAGTSISSQLNDNGTAGNLITYSGGWNRTDMSTQTGMTWYDGQNGFGRAYYFATRRSNRIDRLCGVRFHSVGEAQSTSIECQIGTIYATANNFGLNIAGFNHTVDAAWINNNQNNMFLSSAIGFDCLVAKTCANAEQSCIIMQSSTSCIVENVATPLGNTSDINTNNTAINFNSVQNCTINNADVQGAAGYAIAAIGGTNLTINGGSCTGSGSGGVTADNGCTLYLNDFTINDALEVNINQAGSVGVYSNRHDNTDNNSWVFQSFGTANQQTAVVDSPANTAWKLSPTNPNASAAAPVRLKIGTVVCDAGTLVTVTARMRRTNTGLTMRLVCIGGQIGGVPLDVASNMTAAANTWETVTITFTPTKAGAVDIYAHAFGGTTFSGFVCNLTASQA